MSVAVISLTTPPYWRLKLLQAAIDRVWVREELPPTRCRWDVLNDIFWVLRSGAPWRDLPETRGLLTTCYNRFIRWRRAGVQDRIMDALAAGHDPAVQMIDTSVVRVHQNGARIADNNHQDMGR